jgi:hypothetical protein
MNATPPRGCPCSVPGCPNSARTRGLCNGHYKRLRKHGDVQAGVPLPQEPAKPSCSVPGCGELVLARGWCAKHYNAWKAHGDPLVNLHARTEGPCSVPGCDNPWRAQGLCGSHYTRLRTRGDALASVPLRTYNSGSPQACTVAECARDVKAKGLCEMHYTRARLERIRQEPCVIPDCPHPQYSVEHGWCIPHYQRWQDYGDPLEGPPLRSKNASNPKHNVTASPEYLRNHHRVRTVRGKAWLQVCEHCGGRAWDWATIHGRSGADPTDFMPLCKKCHHVYDGLTWPVMRGEAHGMAKLTEAAVRDIRARYASGERTIVMADEYDVTQASILNVINFRTWKHVA